MLKVYVLLAQAEFDQIPKPSGAPGLSLSRELLLVAGIIFGLAAILFLWAYWTRRDPRRKAEAGNRVLYPAESRKDGKMKVRRRRSRHPNNLPRNPTLAEAGGLPPVREEPAEPAC
jgi:hypothetical protein